MNILTLKTHFFFINVLLFVFIWTVTNAWKIPELLLRKLYLPINRYNIYRNEIVAYVSRNFHCIRYWFIFRKRAIFINRSNDFKYAVQKEQKLFFTFKHLQIKLLIETGAFYIVNHVKNWCRRDLRD